MKLYLKQVDQYFDIEKDITIGPWCFVGVEKDHKDWSKSQFESPFTEVDRFITADRETVNLTNQIMPKLAKMYNKEHLVDYSDIYWRTLLVLWVNTCIQMSWYRYCVVKKLVEKYGNTEIHMVVLDPNVSLSPIADLQEFTNKVIADTEFDYWLSSALIHHLAPKNWKITTIRQDQICGDQIKEPAFGEKSLVRKLVDNLPVGSIPNIGIWRLIFSGIIEFIGQSGDAKDHFTMDQGINEHYFPADYLEFLFAFLEKARPLSYGKFYGLYDQAAKNYKYRPRRLRVENLVTIADINRFRLAHAREKGERLMSLQHGGWYGTGGTFPWGMSAEYGYHGFLTWGWSAHDDMQGNFIAISSPELSVIANKHREVEQTAVLVGAYLFCHGERYLAYPRPEQCDGYFREKELFLQRLDDKVRDSCVYKPHPKPLRSFRDAERIFDRYPHLGNDKRSLREIMLRCRIVFIDHPGTAFHEALCANVPMIAFINESYWPLSNESKSAFDELRKVGILQSSPSDAATMANKVWADIESWWLSDDVQKARKNWCRQYARTRRAWWWDWIKALWSIRRAVE